MPSYSDQRSALPGMLPRALLLFANLFLIILAYYHVKGVSRSLILDFISATNLPYVYIGSAALLLALLPIYQFLVRRYSRISIVLVASAVFVALLIAFRVLLLNPSLEVAVGFYFLVDILSVVMVEQFWSLTNASYKSQEGRRWYGLIGSGGLAGGMVGAGSAQWLIQNTRLSGDDMLLVAAFLIGILLLSTAALSRRGFYRETLSAPKLAAERAALRGWSLFSKDRYLILIAALLLIAQIAEPIVEYQFMNLVQSNLPDRHERDIYLNGFFSLLSGIALGINLLLTPLILSRLGVIGGLLIQPMALAVSSVGFMAMPMLQIASGMKIADRGLSYSLNRAARELLYVPVDPVTIYRAKAWIDMFGYRSFKIIGSGIILILTHFLMVEDGLRALSAVVILLCLCWVVAIFAIRVHFRGLEERGDQPAKPEFL